MRAYLSSAVFFHRAKSARLIRRRTMFTTDSFLNAEVTYRADRARREWVSRRPSAVTLRRREMRDLKAPATR